MSYATKQREAVLSVLEDAPGALSAQDALDASRLLLPKISPATVYRLLGKLEEEQVVQRVELPNSPTRYELIRENHHHHHFICEVCKRAIELPGCVGEVERLAPEGFVVRSHEIVLYGVCSVCAQG